MSTLVEPQGVPEIASSVASWTRVRLFGIEIDAVEMQQAVDWVRAAIRRRPASCRFVVTPNVDHIVRLQSHGDFRRAYRQADLVVADGWPVVWASRRLGRPLPEVVPGSDLVPALFQAASDAVHDAGEPPCRVFLLGAAPGVAARAARRIEHIWPGVTVVGEYSPPLGFEHDAGESAGMLQRISDARPDVLVVGLGAPKQELWVYRHQREIHASVALCAGATIDFLSGQRRRAPLWMRRAKLEWLHRMLSEPRRLIGRYLRGALIFPALIWREWRARKRLIHDVVDHATHDVGQPHVTAADAEW